MAIITNKGFCEPGIIKVLLSVWTGGGWSRNGNNLLIQKLIKNLQFYLTVL